MLRWNGFADLSFTESARLAFARALEQAETEAYQDQADAWVIEDRRVTFSLQTESAPVVLEGTKRLLAALVLHATAGEATIEVTSPGIERWVRRARSPSISKEFLLGDQDNAEDEAGLNRRTVRTAG